MHSRQLEHLVAFHYARILVMKRLTFVITILLSTLAACSPPQAISEHERRPYNNAALYNGRIHYQAPASYWDAVAPSVPMRIDEYEISSQDAGHKQSAVLAVYIFPGHAGGVDSNIARWTAQFKNDSHKQVGNEEQFNLGDMPITTITISGTYLKPSDAMNPASAKTELANQALSVALVELRNETWFFKLIGDADLVKAEKDNFNKLIDSFTLKLQ